MPESIDWPPPREDGWAGAEYSFLFSPCLQLFYLVVARRSLIAWTYSGSGRLVMAMFFGRR